MPLTDEPLRGSDQPMCACTHASRELFQSARAPLQGRNARARPRIRSRVHPRAASLSALLSLALLAPASDAQPESPPLGSAPTTAAQTITLPDAVARALEKNPTFETARQETLRVEAVVREVQASWMPTVAGVGTYTHLDAARYEGNVLVLPQNAVNGSLLVSVPLVMPRQWANWSEAKDNVTVQRASQGDVRRQIGLAVGRAYLAVYTQKLVIEVDERARDTARKHYAYAHQRYSGGVGTSLDEVRAAEEVAVDEALVQQAYAALATAEEALGVVVGADTPLDTASEPVLSAPPSLAAGLDDAARRPDVMQYQLKRSAAERVTRHDYTDYLPYLVGVAEPFYQNPAISTLPQTGYQLELILTLPLYDGGLRYGQARERGALAAEARVGFEGQLRQARSDVRAAFEALRRSDDAYKASRDAARLAHQGLDLANLAYAAGATSDLEVIDAERAARDADTQAEIAADTARQARLGLLSATNHFP
jgi:outer membrane protein TolC